MDTLHKATVKTALLIIAFCWVATPLRAADWQYEGVSRIVAIADIHGAYEALVQALKAAQVVSEDLAWGAGDTHLVIVGDILDRGPDSRPAMDLLMRLEGEAAALGGMVHVLIGNHEAMNLVGDLRYVSTSEYRAFADEERDEERARWFSAYSNERAMGDQAPAALETVFGQKFPAGFFAHRRAFGSEGKYGEWLLSKPAIVVINRTAFVHGGLSPMVAEIGLDGVNDVLIGEMANYVRQLEVLYNNNVLLPTDAFYDHPTYLSRYLPPLDTSVDVLRAVEAVKNLNDSDLHALDGPLWYRGNVMCSELIETDKLLAALDRIGADRVVIGHTPTPGRKVRQRLDGRVLEIDTGMLNPYYGGSANALVIDDSGIVAVNQDSETVIEPAPHPRSVGARPQGSLTADQLELLLSEGQVVASREDAAGRQVYTVSDGAATIEAVFIEREGRGFYPEVAAYRLDRMINLDMVPVTVRRVVDGEDGSLQFLPKNWIDELKRQADGSGGAAWCPIQEQWNAMFVFDVLTYNEGRAGSNILYDLSDWQLMLVDHQKAFSTRKGIPARLKSVPYEVGQRWKDAAAALSEDVLAENLGDVLDTKRLRALAERAQKLADSD